MPSSSDRRSRVLVAGFVGAVLVACVPKFPSDPTVASRLCDAMCDRHVQCQPAKWGDGSSCRRECLADRGPRNRFGGGNRQYWSTEYIDAVLTCTRSASCDAVEVERHYESQCYGDTIPAPSAAAKRVCALEASKAKECPGGGGGRSEGCVSGMARLSEPVLNAALECLGDDGCGWGVKCWNHWVETTRE